MSEPAAASPERLPRSLLTLLAVATGVIIADLYYIQPLLHEVRGGFGISTGAATSLMTLSQVGFALGLAFVLPLGDLLDRRRLLVAIFSLAAVAMALAAVVPGYGLFAPVMVLVGLTSVGAQTTVPFVADLAPPTQRGRAIARVMTGLLAGILLSRTVSGLVAQAAGWRSVYWLGAVLVGITAIVLARVVPADPPRAHHHYGRLLVDPLRLLRDLPVLRRRSLIGALDFAAFNVLWTTLSFHLAGPPFHYSNAVIGAFGLFGVAGVSAANLAGHVADRQRSAGASALAVLLVIASFVLVGVGADSLGLLALGIIILDAGMQGLHITNQSIIYALRPEARSRINSAYMVSCFAGAAAGSLASGALYVRAGWTGDAWLGAGLGVVLLGVVAWRPSAERSPLSA